MKDFININHHKIDSMLLTMNIVFTALSTKEFINIMMAAASFICFILLNMTKLRIAIYELKKPVSELVNKKENGTSSTESPEQPN